MPITDEELQVKLEQMIVEEIQKEIDREVLWGVLKDIGWTKVKISRLKDNEHAVDIQEWLHKACRQKYLTQGREFIFENEREATDFILRWV